MKAKKQTKLYIVIAVLALICLSLTGLTFAWFTDKVTVDDFTLNFGKIELETSSTATANEATTYTTADIKLTRDGTELPKGSFAMPGDKVTINITVKLTENSQPAYYLVYFDDDDMFSCKREFFFKSGDYVYATDGTDARKVDENGNLTTEILADNQVVGIITPEPTDIHQISFVQQIDKSATEAELSGKKTFSCTVYAIQQANMENEKAAYDEIKNLEYATVTFGTGAVMTYDEYGQPSEMTALPSWKQAILNVYGYQTIGFYRTGKQPSSLTYNSDLTAEFDKKQTDNGLEAGKIKVYTNGTTELGFVSDYRIAAPEDSTALFGWIEMLFMEEESWNFDDNLAEGDENATYTFKFDNFYTNNVKDMSFMFAFDYFYKEYDLSKWDTSNVTDMKYMFYCNSGCTELDLSRWNTSKVTDMSFMFAGMAASESACSQFTKLNLTGWDTSSVTNMNAMFLYCELIEKLDLSGFNTSSAVNMSSMFYDCRGLKELDLSGFDLTNAEAFDVFMVTEGGGSNLEKIILPKEGKWGSLTSFKVTAGYYMKSQKTGEVLGKQGAYAYIEIDASSSYAGETLTACGQSFLYWRPYGMDKTTITSIKFEKTAPSGYTKIDNYRKIDYYVNSDSTQLVVVCPLTIYAQNEINRETLSFSAFTSLQKIEFNNFDTSKINASNFNKFSLSCSSLTEIVITNSFTYDDNGTQTLYTKAKLISDFGLSSSVTVTRNGVEITE